MSAAIRYPDFLVMNVFRDLIRARIPELKHDTGYRKIVDVSTGISEEPPPLSLRKLNRLLFRDVARANKAGTCAPTLDFSLHGTSAPDNRVFLTALRDAAREITGAGTLDFSHTSATGTRASFDTQALLTCATGSPLWEELAQYDRRAELWTDCVARRARQPKHSHLSHLWAEMAQPGSETLSFKASCLEHLLGDPLNAEILTASSSYDAALKSLAASKKLRTRLLRRLDALGCTDITYFNEGRTSALFLADRGGKPEAGMPEHQLLALTPLHEKRINVPFLLPPIHEEMLKGEEKSGIILRVMPEATPACSLPKAARDKALRTLKKIMARHSLQFIDLHDSNFGVYRYVDVDDMVHELPVILDWGSIAHRGRVREDWAEQLRTDRELAPWYAMQTHIVSLGATPGAPHTELEEADLIPTGTTRAKR